jgi:hypothetical protein
MTSRSSDCCVADLCVWFFFSPGSRRSAGGDDDAPGDADPLGERIAFAGGDGVVSGVDTAECTGPGECLTGGFDSTGEAAVCAGAGGRVIAGRPPGDAVPTGRSECDDGVAMAVV